MRQAISRIDCVAVHWYIQASLSVIHFRFVNIGNISALLRHIFLRINYATMHHFFVMKQKLVISVTYISYRYFEVTYFVTYMLRYTFQPLFSHSLWSLSSPFSDILHEKKRKVRMINTIVCTIRYAHLFFLSFFFSLAMHDKSLLILRRQLTRIAEFVFYWHRSDHEAYGLTHFGLVTPYGDIDLRPHWFR